VLLPLTLQQTFKFTPLGQKFALMLKLDILDPGTSLSLLFKILDLGKLLLDNHAQLVSLLLLDRKHVLGLHRFELLLGHDRLQGFHFTRQELSLGLQCLELGKNGGLDLFEALADRLGTRLHLGF
jgi:hypothetical protein